MLLLRLTRVTLGFDVHNEAFDTPYYLRYYDRRASRRILSYTASLLFVVIIFPPTLGAEGFVAAQPRVLQWNFVGEASIHARIRDKRSCVLDTVEMTSKLISQEFFTHRNSSRQRLPRDKRERVCFLFPEWNINRDRLIKRAGGRVLMN